MFKKEESNIQGKHVEEQLIFEGERDVMQYHRMRKIADMLSKVVEGKDFTIQTGEEEYLLEALKSTDKRVYSLGGYLDDAEEKDAMCKEIIDSLKNPVDIIVASTKDMAIVKRIDGVQYIWVRE